MREEETSAGLDRLWNAYRIATSDPQVSPNFVPELWARIEEARAISWIAPLTRWAARLLPLAAALTLAMSAYIWNPLSSAGGDGLVSGYVDTLADDLLDEQRPALLMSGGEENR